MAANTATNTEPWYPCESHLREKSFDGTKNPKPTQWTQVTGRFVEYLKLYMNHRIKKPVYNNKTVLQKTIGIFAKFFEESLTNTITQINIKKIYQE